MADTEASKDEHLCGVGGWLVVFLVLFAAYPITVAHLSIDSLLYVVRGPRGGIVLIARFGPVQYDISFVRAIIEWVALFAGLAFVGYTIFRLIYRRDGDTIRFTQAAIVVVAFVIPVVESMLVLAARLGAHLLYLFLSSFWFYQASAQPSLGQFFRQYGSPIFRSLSG